MTTSSDRSHESIINYVSARLLREQTKLLAVAETPYDGNRAGGVLLTGGNPQPVKENGNDPVQGCVAATSHNVFTCYYW